MLKNRIIPCLDVKNGRVVKGINFVDLQDAGDPVEQACSTGSPASCKSTKLIPFTTLPFLTSKQGIILFLSIYFFCKFI